ncbi:jg14518 [Pararge aegeria aegeria]|uniref:Jg14518 protein n=1 Tax=Pararge aegeria aegeria TaxID=348720 RepID=A0A8S4RW21_9NEOP|nr:jg14518 [Pararge aegeria aegeria]
MAYFWIFVILSWFGSVSLQYINTAGQGAETLLDPIDSSIHYPPLPYVNYFNMPFPRSNYDSFPNDETDQAFYSQGQESLDFLRKRRTVVEDIKEENKEKRWLPDLIDSDKTIYLRNDGNVNPFIIQALANALEGNANDSDVVQTKEDKRSFSPWGGKRDKPLIEHTWTWKRSPGIREPSMPKRVRFSPWGGKRSGQMIYKPGNKSTKVIFSASMPELTRIISNYSPNGKSLDVAGFQFVPSLGKRHPIRILALSTNMDERTLRDALPYNTFMEPMPRIYKPGHPYSDVNLKKDGKRKVKFSAWGGKRSPPIIGPIWTPASQDLQESTLNTIVLVRKQDNEAKNL